MRLRIVPSDSHNRRREFGRGEAVGARGGDLARSLVEADTRRP